ncbi:MAG: hypothetical protein COT73_02210 [Bdellovibrio sp. CG10_big_fil_rev_8_21_14_0_10_47_8]|nr:MAG: hypothetical protein COT73_02210 [Bdellovibrio sp. CG10_big_fil_rev_8_21_14_0_10_47_8]
MLSAIRLLLQITLVAGLWQPVLASAQDSDPSNPLASQDRYTTETFSTEIESKTVEVDGQKFAVFSEKGQVIFQTPIPASQDLSELTPSEQKQFVEARDSFLKKLVRFFSRKQPHASISIIDDRQIETIESLNPHEQIKPSLYRTWLHPVVMSLYNVGSKAAKIFIQKRELGLSFVAQGYGVTGISKAGLGMAQGIAMDIGYDQLTHRLFVGLYRTEAKYSAAMSLPDAGFNFTFGVRADSSLAQATVVQKQLLSNFSFSVLKENRASTMMMNGLIPYTVIVSEYTDHYMNFTGGLGLTLNPLPGTSEYKASSRGYKVYVTNPLVLFSPLFKSFKNIDSIWKNFFRARSPHRCGRVYIS